MSFTAPIKAANGDIVGVWTNHFNWDVTTKPIRALARPSGAVVFPYESCPPLWGRGVRSKGYSGQIGERIDRHTLEADFEVEVDTG